MENNLYYSLWRLCTIFTLWGAVASCGTAQSQAIIHAVDLNACVTHNYFKPYVTEYLKQDKRVPYEELDGRIIHIDPIGSKYFNTVHADLDMNLYVYEYHEGSCYDCNYVVLYSEEKSVFYVVDQDDYAFWIERPDRRDDEQLRSFFDSTGVVNLSELWLLYLVQYVYKFDLTDTVSREYLNQHFEHRLSDANQYPVSNRIAGKAWGRKHLINHIRSSRDRATLMMDTLHGKGYRLYWDLNFKDGSFAVLVYINPEHPLDFGIEYF